MKVFISQPMAGLTRREIFQTRAKIIKDMSFEDQVIPSVLTKEPVDDNKGALKLLGQAIEKMADADVVYFAKGWEDSRGCRVEHQCAEDYGKIIIEEVNECPED